LSSLVLRTKSSVILISLLGFQTLQGEITVWCWC